MAKLIIKTLQYYDWGEVTKEVEANCGRKVRDWAGKWGHGLENQRNPYQDFWHKILDYDSQIHNGCITTYDFEEIATYFDNINQPWVREVCNEYIKVLGQGEHTFRIEW
jgi:hypothetical protein